MGYHAGVLKALDEVGLDPAGADVIIGTSAGSVIAAYMASGWEAADFFADIRRRARSIEPDPEREEASSLFEPLWSSPSDRLRRTMRAWFAAASSPGLWPPRVARRLATSRARKPFPTALYSTTRVAERLRRDLPASWPRPSLYICAADLETGRRVAFGRPHEPRASLPDAVLASTAIPGVFPPVKIDGRYYVDGGNVSASSLDLAAAEGCRDVLCLAPLGYRTEGRPLALDPKLWPLLALRQPFVRFFSRELAQARARGVRVLVVQPWVSELRALGINAMRRHDRVAVSEAARRGALRLFADNIEHPVLTAFKKETVSGHRGG